MLLKDDVCLVCLHYTSDIMVWYIFDSFLGILVTLISALKLPVERFTIGFMTCEVPVVYGFYGCRSSTCFFGLKSSLHSNVFVHDIPTLASVPIAFISRVNWCHFNFKHC